MFTGIVAGLLTVKSIRPLHGGKEIGLILPNASQHLRTGDSIALNGVCTTAIQISDTGFWVQLLSETLSKTTLTHLKVGDQLNWELSATPTTALGGHLVYGHVDETGQIHSITRTTPWTIVSIAFGSKYSAFLVPKGAICIDGISLTVVDIRDNIFSVHIIPHTFESTVLRNKKTGDPINLEYDIVAKYLYNFKNVSNQDASLFTTLNKAGFI